MAAAAALDGDGRQALIYLGATEALREETGSPLPPPEAATLARALAPALAALSEREQQLAREEGRSRPHCRGSLRTPWRSRPRSWTAV